MAEQQQQMTFTNPAILKLIEEIRKDSSGPNRCLISRFDITECNSVCLPCGHSYHIDYYSGIKRKRRCAYCSEEYEPTLLEKPCEHVGCTNVTSIQNGLCVTHNQRFCEHVFVRGKNVGCTCTARAVRGSSFCRRHNTARQSLIESSNSSSGGSS